MKPIVECPYCGIRVVPMADDVCPACRRPMVEEPPKESAERTSKGYCRNCGRTVPPDAGRCRCGAPPMEGRNFCDCCGDPTYIDESVCPNCGRELATGPAPYPNTVVASNPPKQPGQIAAMSLFLPWWGQIALGQDAKGFLMLLATTVWTGLWWFGAMILPLLAAIDGYVLAKELQAGRAIGPWDFFWGLRKSDRPMETKAGG